MLVKMENPLSSGGGIQTQIVLNTQNYNSTTGSTIQLEIPFNGTLKLFVADYYGGSSLTQNGTTVTKIYMEQNEHQGINYWEVQVNSSDTIILNKGNNNGKMWGAMGVVTTE